MQVAKCAIHDDFFRGSRTWEIFDRVMDVENERIRQAANIVETLLRDACLADGDHKSCDEGEHYGRRSGDANFVPQHELGGAVARGILSRHDWQVCKIPSDVFGKLLDRGITSLRFLA